jgi:hypothetical protein
MDGCGLCSLVGVALAVAWMGVVYVLMVAM